MGSDFKIGDRVRVSDLAEEAFDHIGKTGKIVSIDIEVKSGKIFGMGRKTEFKQRDIEVLFDGDNSTTMVPDNELEFEQ